MGKRSKGKVSKSANQIYLPPSLFVGEILVWKGYTWRLQAYSPNGGQVTLEDETGKGQVGQFKDCVVVMECAGKSAGTLRRERAAAKRPAVIKQNGFRPQPVLVQEKSDIVVPEHRIIRPDEASLIVAP